MVLSSCAILAMSCSRSTTVTSPDGSIVFSLSVDSIGAMRYTVGVDNRTIVAPSLLGLVGSGVELSDGFVVCSVKHRSQDEVWTQPWGENKTLRDRHNEMVVLLRNASQTELTLRVRAFDDGVGLRYEYVAHNSDSLTIADEKTQFCFAADGESWSIAASPETYELPYRNKPISNISDANTPFTFCIGGIYGSIHEAALYDFPEMTLRNMGGTALKAELAPLPDGTKARVGGLFVTPWRTIQIGRKAVDLINSSLILNLNEPSKIENTEWIHPQKYVGIWWGMHLGTQTWTLGPQHGATTQNAIQYIDFAAENRIQGVLFEGWNRGWENWGGSQEFDYRIAQDDFDMTLIADYAREKGVELWAHNETGGNISQYEEAMEPAMALYEQLGIHTLKTGYAGGFANGCSHHSQYGVRHYQRVVEQAARHKIMLNVHEPIKDTGIRRTWPNMMTREGARGMEWNAWSEGNSSEYLCTMPFVRLLGGPMDYTPGIFDIDFSRAKADPHRIMWNGDNSRCCIKTTLARQIANWVIIYSPLQMASDQIENYEGHAAFQFFRDFDADCDRSRAIAGEIGEYIVVVRQAKERFFVGAGTNAQPRNIALPLDFLERGTLYCATFYADNTASSNPEDCLIEEYTLSVADTVTLKMAANGGCAVSLIPLSH